MLSNYRWYRKLKGGTWFHNRYIFDLGRTIIFKYERRLPSYGWCYNIKEYNEEWQ